MKALNDETSFCMEKMNHIYIKESNHLVIYQQLNAKNLKLTINIKLIKPILLFLIIVAQNLLCLIINSASLFERMTNF